MLNRSPDICMVSSLHPATDKRVYEKELMALRARGFDVVHIAPNLDGSEDAEHCITYPPGRNRIVNTFRMLSILRRLDSPRAVHANELDSFLFSIPWARRKRLPLVLDIHEDYSGEIALRFPRVVQPAARRAVDVVQRFLTWTAAHTVLAKQTLFDALPWLDEESATVVANYGPITPDTLRSTPVPGRLHLVHAGLISRARCWPMMLSLLVEPGLEHVTLEFVGTVNDPDPGDIVREAERLGVIDRVSFTGWVERGEMMARLGRSDVGLLMLEVGNTNHVRALPHKVFDYMIAGLPILVPQHCEELVPIIDNYGCGVVIDVEQKQSVVDAIKLLDSDPSLRTSMGQRGVDAIEVEYNWESQAEKLSGVYLTLLGDPAEMIEVSS